MISQLCNLEFYRYLPIKTNSFPGTVHLISICLGSLMRCSPPAFQVVENMANLCSRCKKFEANDEPITCVALKGGPCSVCKEMVAIRHQIKQLEEELAKLKAKHNTILTTMNAIHDLFIHDPFNTNSPQKSALISFASA